MEGVENTYQVLYDDTEFEIIEETKLEKFVTKEGTPYEIHVGCNQKTLRDLVTFES